MKPYYQPGDVFDRQPQYYTQQLTSIRNRSTSPSAQYIRPKIISSMNLKNQTRLYQKMNNSFDNNSQIQRHSRIRRSPIFDRKSVESERREQLQQNKKLKQQLSQLLESKYPKYKQIIMQNQQIFRLRNIHARNVDKINELQSVRKEFQGRMKNIIHVDNKICTILDQIDQDPQNYRSIINAAQQALVRGSSRATVINLLQNIFK